MICVASSNISLSVIRQTHLLDIPRLLELASQYQDEIIEADKFVPVIDAELAATNMMNTMQSDMGLSIVAVDGTKVVGFLWALVVYPVPWSHYRSADTLMFYVHPDYRGGLHGYRLLKAYKSWAEMVECDEIRLSTASGINTERAEGIFRKLGFSPLGTVFHIKKTKE